MRFIQSERLTSKEGIVHGFADRTVGADASEIENYFNLSRLAQLAVSNRADKI